MMNKDEFNIFLNDPLIQKVELLEWERILLPHAKYKKYETKTYLNFQSIFLLYILRSQGLSSNQIMSIFMTENII